MNDILKKLSNIGIVPVVTLNHVKNAVPLAKALFKGGIGTAEITFRTAAAKESIKAIAQEVPELLVGAGTVTTVDMAQEAFEAGAKYIVSPGLNPKVVKWCLEHSLPILPGVSTPTEIEAAMELGVTTLKFFPATQSGGVPMLKALASPYKSVKFVPTGGIDLKNFREYLDLPNVIACGGSWICPTSLIDDGQFDRITELCREAVVSMHDFKLLHIGLNSVDEKEAQENCQAFSNMFSLPVKEAPSAFFAGTMMEVVKEPFLGENGHIAISVNNMERAVAYFEGRGYKFIEEGIAYDEKGLVAIYFEQEIGGFAIHLRRKP